MRLLIPTVILLFCSTNLVEGANIYWLQDGNIRRAKLDGSEITTVLNVGDAETLEADELNQFIYWRNSSDQLRRINLDATGNQLVATVPSVFPAGDVVVDTPNGQMFVTIPESFGAGDGFISQVTLPGGPAVNFQSGLYAHAAAIDSVNQHLYWTESFQGKIQRSDLDGSNVVDILTGLDSPHGIVLDVTGGKMYWGDPAADKIQRADLNGSNVEDIVTGTPNPLDIEIDLTGGKLYWADREEGIIHRSNLDGSSLEDLLTGLGDVRQLGLDLLNVGPPIAPSSSGAVPEPGTLQLLLLLAVLARYRRESRSR